MGTIKSKWAAIPINLKDRLDEESWSGATESQMTIPGGYLLAKNDAKYLYIALDMVEDTHNDPGTDDYFWFSFDRNGNRAITPNYDVNYGIYRGQPNKMGRQFYLGAGRWTALLNEVSKSECRIAFQASPNSSTPHRIWKIRFKLNDIRVNQWWWWLSSYARFGLRVHSATPDFNYDSPVNFYQSFTNLHTVYFSRKPVISSSDTGPVMGSVGLIPTTKINPATGKATTASNYFIFARNSAFGGTLSVIGNRTKLQQLPSAGAKKYKVFHRVGTSGSFSELVTSWYNYKWDSSDYVLVASSPDSNNFYAMPNSSIDYSIDDLLFQFDSTKLNTGLHQFKVKFYNHAGVEVGAISPEQILTMYIDNNVPEVSINSIIHGGSKVNACGIVKLTSPTDDLTIDFDAFDGEGNLLGYTLSAQWGEGHSQVIRSEQYDTVSMPASWTGGKGMTANWIPLVTCAHSFNVRATARTTNGYSYIGRNSTYRYATLIKP